jgi:Tol biopolymer transport system component
MRRHSFDFVLVTAAIGLASAFGASCQDDETTKSSSTDDDTSSSTTSSTTTTTTGGMGGTGGDTGGGGAGAQGGGGTGGTGGSGGTGGTGGVGGAGGGVGGGGAPPVLSEKAYYWGEPQTDLVHTVGVVEYPGPVHTVFSLDGLVGGSDMAGVAVSPDGTQIAVAGRDMMGGVYTINLYAADGTGLATNLVTGGSPTVDFDALQFSPDGDWLAYRADATINDGYELWVVPTAGGMPKRVSQTINAAAQDVTTYAWQPDVSGMLKYIAYQGDAATDGVFSAFGVEITANSPAPVNLAPMATNTQSVGTGVPQFDALGRVWIRGDLEVDNTFRIYRVNVDGTMFGSIAHGLTNGNGEASVGSLGISPDRALLAFGADSPTATNYQVHVMDLANMQVAPVSNVAMGVSTNSFIGPDFAQPIAWSDDQQFLAARADWPVNADANNDDWSAYVFPVSGGGVRIVHVPQGASQDVEQVAFTANSARLFLRGDLVANNDQILASTADFATASQDPNMLVEVDPPANGDINGLTIAP